MGKIIFLFSLPRAGSTLLQRILSANAAVKTLPEPWVLLPQIYALRSEGEMASYSCSIAKRALNHFIDSLPRGMETYNRALNEFYESLVFSENANGASYFLDKTPRYHSIIKEISEVFPDAKFIFLFRNPLQVISSIMETWCESGFKNMYKYDFDLSKGFENLTLGRELLGDRAFALRYEDLVCNPSSAVKNVCSYLGIRFSEEMLSKLPSEDYKGKMGDQTGIKRYSLISPASSDKWRSTIDTRYKCKVVGHYVDRIPADVLKKQGYDKKKIKAQLNERKIPFSLDCKSRVSLIYSDFVRVVKPHIWLGKSASRWARSSFID